MENLNILKHITDVGSSNWNWVDSNLRIKKQYERLWILSETISAWQSPIHVAFCASTDLSQKATNNAYKLLEKIGHKKTSPLPVALNCAPRNDKNCLKDAKENYIYRVKVKTWEIFLIYGIDVLRFIIEFYTKEDILVEKIISIHDIINDTSSWSQFRSWEYLPIVHFLEFKNLLDSFSIKEKVDVESIPSIYKNKHNHIIIAPPDEYNNWRLIVSREIFNELFLKENIKIPYIYDDNHIYIKKSLTEIIPGEISIWPSSNHLTNENLKVINIWTRWKPKTTTTTNENIIKISNKLSLNVWKSIEINL